MPVDSLPHASAHPHAQHSADVSSSQAHSQNYGIVHRDVHTNHRGRKYLLRVTANASPNAHAADASPNAHAANASPDPSAADASPNSDANLHGVIPDNPDAANPDAADSSAHADAPDTSTYANASNASPNPHPQPGLQWCIRSLCDASPARRCYGKRCARHYQPLQKSGAMYGCGSGVHVGLGHVRYGPWTWARVNTVLFEDRRGHSAAGSSR